MSDPATAGQTNCPDPDQDRRATGAEAPNPTGRLLGLVRALIDYGKRLANTLEQRASAAGLADITRHFGTLDIGQILARITRGLQRAAALEARLVSRPVRQPAPPAALGTRSLGQPRAASPVGRSASTADTRLAHLPTMLRRSPAEQRVSRSRVIVWRSVREEDRIIEPALATAFRPCGIAHHASLHIGLREPFQAASDPLRLIR